MWHEWSPMKKLIWLRRFASGASYILKTVTGAIVHITDAIAGAVESLSVSVEPIQNLNGYDHPWPAGGGKNLFNIAALWADGVNRKAGNDTCRYYTVPLPNGDYTVSTNVIDNSPATIASVFITNNTSTVSSTRNGVFLNAPRTITAENNYLVIAIRVISPDGYLAWDENSFAPYYIQLESGSTATEYEPYSNICPISGFDSVTVNRTGKNLCYKVLPYATSLMDGNYAKILPSAGASAIFKCVKGETYTVSGATGRNRGLVAYFDSDPTTGSESVYPNTVNVSMFEDGFTFTAEHTAYADCYLANGALPEDVHIQIELGFATAYEPYQGNTYTIQLGQTVYGGTLDAVNGTMTVDRAMVTIDGTAGSWYSRSGTPNPVYYVTAASLGISIAGTSWVECLSNTFLIEANNAGYAGSKIGAGSVNNANLFFCSTKTSLADFRAGLATEPITVVYPLATPFELTLTPQQIATLQGENNVWSDAGDVTMTYRASAS